MIKSRIIYLLIALLIFTGCFKEDEKIEPHQPGDIKLGIIPMTSTYLYQVYFSLESDQIISQNEKTDWDLGFEATKDGWHVILNTSNFMWAANAGFKDFSLPIDTSGMNWKFDNSDGDLDSTAIGSWLEINDNDTVYKKQVYIINRGYDEVGNLRGLRKIIFEEVDANNYKIGYGGINDIQPISFTISKDSLLNYVFFSFNNGGVQLNLEPSKTEWDLWFTQYTTILITTEGDPYPYLVTGALINRFQGIEVAENTSLDFNDITQDQAEQLVYSDSLDVIGYDWKEVIGDVQSGNVSYVVRMNLNYIIRTKEGIYYKLRFISFYSEMGEKGYPTFEYQQL